MEQQPTLVERFADNGGHSHWDLIDASNGELLWSGDDELYSDQQNKELEEKLMSEQIENGYLQAFRVSNEAEIQRLTKEVERLKLRCDRAVQFAGSMGGENTRLREEVEELKNDLLDALDLKNGNGPTALTMLSNEITRLRELLGETLKWLQWSSHSDAQLLASKIDNALNHKP